MSIAVETFPTCANCGRKTTVRFYALRNDETHTLRPVCGRCYEGWCELEWREPKGFSVIVPFADKDHAWERAS